MTCGEARGWSALVDTSAMISSCLVRQASIPPVDGGSRWSRRYPHRATPHRRRLRCLRTQLNPVEALAIKAMRDRRLTQVSADASTALQEGVRLSVAGFMAPLRADRGVPWVDTRCRARRKRQSTEVACEAVTGSASSEGTDRVAERRRAVALARHYRQFEGLSIRQIAVRLGRSPATVKAYFYDPTGEKARAVKARYVGVCRGCGAYTQPRNGKGDAYAYCKACHPGAIERRWTRERVVAAMRDWHDRHGRLPSSYDWSRTHARRRGGEALERVAHGNWPAASVVTRLFGSWAAARAAASGDDLRPRASRSPAAGLRLGSNSVSLPKPQESTAKTEDLREGEEERQQAHLQGFSICRRDFAHNSGR